jgi:hypothetical protein
MTWLHTREKAALDKRFADIEAEPFMGRFLERTVRSRISPVDVGAPGWRENKFEVEVTH